MQTRPPRLFRDGGAILSQRLRKLALQLELPARELVDGSRIRGQSLEIGEPPLRQPANDLARLKLDFGIGLPVEGSLDFRQRFRNAVEFDQRPGKIQSSLCIA